MLTQGGLAGLPGAEKAASLLAINVLLIGGKWLRSRAGRTREAGGHLRGKDFQVYVGSLRGKQWKEADSVFFLPKVQLVSGDDTAPR